MKLRPYVHSCTAAFVSTHHLVRFIVTTFGKAASSFRCAYIQVWDLQTLQKVRTLTGHSDAVRALAVADGKLFSGSYDSTVRVWDENSLECLEVLKGHTGPVRTLVHCRSNMFSGSYDRTVKVSCECL